MSDSPDKYRRSNVRQNPPKETMAGQLLKGLRAATKERSAERADMNNNMTPAQKKAVLAIERDTVNLPYERLDVVNANGRTLLSKNGEKQRVQINGYEMPLLKDQVVTHNHPWMTKEGLMGVGAPFSPDDIRTTMRGNASEIRATSGGYTYSIQRPKDGWHGNPQDVYNTYERAYMDVIRHYLNNDKRFSLRRKPESRGYLSIDIGGKTYKVWVASQKDGNAFLTRQIAACNAGVKAAQKKFGFTYKRGKTRMN